ncbi:MAG: hypothetical protein Q7J32_16930 [Sphingomonadaceae bacterium]|nr:hypothetical protein [Sphingomonadaceae bacterium]
MRGNHKLIAFLALLMIFVVVVVMAAAFEHDEMTLRLMDAAVVGLVGVIGGAGQAIFRYSQGETLPAGPPRDRPPPAPIALSAAVPERPSWEA